MSEVTEVECGICGRVGQPPKGCEVCHGGAATQERAYTLSEHRVGIAPKEDRFGVGEESLNPRTSNLVVGGAMNHPGLRPPLNPEN